MAILAQNSLQDQELKERSRREFGRTGEKGGVGTNSTSEGNSKPDTPIDG